MNDIIKLVLALQAKDLDLDRLELEIAGIPGKISAIQKEIQSQKAALEGAKKDLQQFQVTKKQRELDLEAQEASVRKHAGELNSVKTNEAYRALMGEIDKAKLEKSKLEDQILQLMEQIDQANVIWKEKENISKGQEGDLLKQISDLEALKKSLEQQVADKQTQRAEALAALPKAPADVYERLRKNRKGAAAVVIVKEQCTGCHMKVSQNLINEIRRAQKLMTCESCSRIVYLEDAPAAKAEA